MMSRLTRLSILRVLADLVLAGAAVGLFLFLPYGTIVNGLLGAVVFILGGSVIDRMYLSRLSPEDRAAEMRARAKADP